MVFLAKMIGPFGKFYWSKRMGLRGPQTSSLKQCCFTIFKIDRCNIEAKLGFDIGKISDFGEKQKELWFWWEFGEIGNVII